MGRRTRASPCIVWPAILMSECPLYLSSLPFPLLCPSMTLNPIHDPKPSTLTCAADGTLFEFDNPAGKWRERGKGEFKLNLDQSGQVWMEVWKSSGEITLGPSGRCE